MFKNRIRLPLYIKEPQFPTEANRFRLSNGASKTLSVTIRKTFSLITDYIGELAHQRLVVALNHDEVSIEGDKYVGGVTVDGDYDIQWPDFLDYPLGQANVKIQVTPFDMTNDNCATCEEASQLSLVDDEAGEINEGEAVNVNAYDNDTICCFPITAEITWFDTGYLDSVTIVAATGVITLTAKDPAFTVGNIKMATYRVTCPDGSYDEADVYASISGSEPECEQPAGFEVPVISAPPSPFSVDIEWATPAAGADGYDWELYEVGNPVLIDSGTNPDNTITITAPQPATEYIFYVRKVCTRSGSVYSAWGSVSFTTPANDVETCGLFGVSCDDHTVEPNVYYYSFMDCNGNIQTLAISNLEYKENCMLMSDPGIPVYFQGHSDYITYEYLSLC